MPNMVKVATYLPLWLFSATTGLTYFKRLAKIPSLCMYVCMYVCMPMYVCMYGLGSRQEATWLPKAAQVDITISILYIHNMLKQVDVDGLWMDCEWMWIRHLNKPFYPDDWATAIQSGRDMSAKPVP